MTAVVAMPTALGVCAWLQVAHGNFLSVLFVHITLPFFVVFGLCQFCRIFFRFDHSRQRYDHSPCQKISWQSSYASTQFDQERKSLI